MRPASHSLTKASVTAKLKPYNPKKKHLTCYKRTVSCVLLKVCAAVFSTICTAPVQIKYQESKRIKWNSMCSLYETKAKDHDTAVTISSHFLLLCLYSLIFNSVHSHVTDQCARFLKYLQPILSSLKLNIFSSITCFPFIQIMVLNRHSWALDCFLTHLYLNYIWTSSVWMRITSVP